MGAEDIIRKLAEQTDANDPELGAKLVAWYQGWLAAGRPMGPDGEVEIPLGLFVDILDRTAGGRPFSGGVVGPAQLPPDPPQGTADEGP
jgi:hypothetical protein